MDEVSETNGVNEPDEINKTNEINEADEVIESDDNEQASGTNLVMASRWKRLFGALIDGVISMVLMFIVMAQMGVLKNSFEGIKPTTNERIYLALIGWGAFLIIHGYLLFKRGQTVGKILVGTKIVDSNGNIPNFGKLLLLRYLVLGLIGQIPFVGGLINLADVLFIFGQERRCLHDYLAGTYVVNESDIINEVVNESEVSS